MFRKRYLELTVFGVFQERGQYPVIIKRKFNNVTKKEAKEKMYKHLMDGYNNGGLDIGFRDIKKVFFADKHSFID